MLMMGEVVGFGQTLPGFRGMTALVSSIIRFYIEYLAIP